jgi:hypothetical protein
MLAQSGLLSDYHKSASSDIIDRTKNPGLALEKMQKKTRRSIPSGTSSRPPLEAMIAKVDRGDHRRWAVIGLTVGLTLASPRKKPQTIPRDIVVVKTLK